MPKQSAPLVRLLLIASMVVALPAALGAPPTRGGPTEAAEADGGDPTLATVLPEGMASAVGGAPEAPLAIGESSLMFVFTAFLLVLAGAAALSGLGVTQRVTRPRRDAGAYLLLGMYLLLVIMTTLLFLQMFVGSDVRLMIQTPLRPVAGGQYAVLAMLMVGFVAMAGWVGRHPVRAVVTRLRRGGQEAERLARAQEELGAFTAAAAHDLRSPARSIQVNAQLLMRSLPDLSASAQQTLEGIRASAHRMDELIQALMRYTSLSGEELEWKETTVSNLGLAIHTDLHGLMQARDADVAFEGEAAIHGDAAMVRQAVQNLVENAVKYSQRPWVRVRVNAVDGGTEVRVVDRGPGIAATEQERVLRPFERGTTSEAGHGLGLAIVQRIMAKHGGHFTLAGERGQGTTAVLWFPDAPPVAGEGHAPWRAQAAGMRPRPG